MRRLLLAIGLAGAALAVPAGPAIASSGACPSSSGVTVQVDFASLGGGTQVGCAPGDPSSGLAALQAAGFTPSRAAQEPGYYVCRINGRPASDPCQRTSPSTAYWSYWHASPGGGWTYSSQGAADYNPAPGTVEGWAFGAGKPPSRPPAAAASPAASAAPTRPVATTPWSKGAAAPARAAASASPASARAPASRPPSPSALATASPSPAAPAAASPSASLSPAASPAAVADPASPTRLAPGGPLVAAALVALLGGGALLQRRRRRSAR